MDFPVKLRERTVGYCTLTEDGLYWQLDCSCQVLSDQIERLYCEDKRLGILEREGERLSCHRRLSKASTPQLPPKSGFFTLEPYTPWQGTLAGCPVAGFRSGEMLLFPYDPKLPCPCEPLICFFSIRDGFWQLPMEGTWEITEY